MWVDCRGQEEEERRDTFMRGILCAEDESRNSANRGGLPEAVECKALIKTNVGFRSWNKARHYKQNRDHSFKST